jgi:hypothetical protein
MKLETEKAQLEAVLQLMPDESAGKFAERSLKNLKKRRLSFKKWIK